MLDSEIREIVVPDLTARRRRSARPSLFRARTPRDIQQLKADPQAVPATGASSAGPSACSCAWPAYGAGAPALSVHLLNRAGQTMSELPVTPSATPGGESTVDIPLAGLAPGEYIVEVKATGESGEAKELVGFRVTN